MKNRNLYVLIIGSAVCLVLLTAFVLKNLPSDIKKINDDQFLDFANSKAIEQNFDYYILDDGTIRINAYNGSEKTVELPERLYGKKITSIAENTFSDCDYLNSIVIPETVTEVSNEAFKNCVSLTSVTLPSSIVSANYSDGDSLVSTFFSSCNGIENIIISDKTKSIGKGVFYACGNIKKVTIPNSVTSIGAFAFYECSGLTEITIPDSVTSIGYGAFYECTGISEVDIPDSIISMDEKVFAWCSNLKSISIPDYVASDDYYKLRVKENGDTYYKPMSMIPFYFTHNIRHINVKEGATGIGDYALYEFSDLESITIPDTVTSIGKYSFYKCTGLKSITIPYSVKSIGEEAFGKCDQLTVYGYSGSVAEQYAEKNGLKFVEITDTSDESANSTYRK